MINFNNHNITGMSYNNHTIKKAYGCDGRLVWSGNTEPVFNGKLGITYLDGRTYELGCDGTYNSHITSADTHPSGYDYHSILNVYIGGNCRNVYVDDDALCCSNGVLNIKMSDGVRTIGKESFKGIGVRNVVLSNDLRTIRKYAFERCVFLERINIPNSVTTLGDGIFFGCERMVSAILPNSITSIPYDMFDGCSSLTKINIPSNVNSIGENAFYGCHSLTEANIQSGVNSIGKNAFNGCLSLTEINIPSSVNSIGANAFYNCRSLTSATVNATVPPTKGNNAFTGTRLQAIYVPPESVEAYKSAWSSLASYIQPIP